MTAVTYPAEAQWSIVGAAVVKPSPTPTSPPTPGAPSPGGQRPHTLMGLVSLTIGGADFTSYAEGLSFDTVDTGGYSSASFTLRPSMGPPAIGALAELSGPGGTLWRGVVVASPSLATGADNAPYTVTMDGESTLYGRAGDFAMGFVDRDISQWQALDSPDWQVTSPVQLSANAQTMKICGALDFSQIAWQEPVVTQTAYDYTGNAPPDYDPADFTDPPQVWSALVYHVQGGQTDDVISQFNCDASAYFDCINTRGMALPDYTSPAEPPDYAVNGNRFATYPGIPLWDDAPDWIAGSLYGVDFPGTMFACLYACDNLADLPVGNALHMLAGTHLGSTADLLHVFEPKLNVVTYGDDPGHGLTLAVADRKYVVLYASIIPVQVPVHTAVVYNEGAGNLERSVWYPLNQLFLEGTEEIVISSPTVVCNSFADWATNNITTAIKAVVPECTVVGGDLFPDPFVAPIGDNVTGGVSLMARPFKTQLQAIQDLLSLTSAQTVWGWYGEAHHLVIGSPDMGGCPVTEAGDTPGVVFAVTDKVDGIIDTCTVLYQPPMDASAGAGKLGLAEVAAVTVDSTGAECEPAQRSDVIDKTATCGTKGLAMMAGMKEIKTRGVEQFDGTVTLPSIGGAAAVRAGQTLGGMLVTRTSYDVDSDTATLQFGGTGYAGRFAPKPGQPRSAAPHVAANISEATIRGAVLRSGG